MDKSEGIQNLQNFQQSVHERPWASRQAKEKCYEGAALFYLGLGEYVVVEVYWGKYTTKMFIVKNIASISIMHEPVKK